MMPVAMRSRPQPLTKTAVPPSVRSALLMATAEALSQTGYGQLRKLGLSSDGDSIILAGRVSTYFLKQLAQTVAMGVPGVQCVVNELQVDDEDVWRE